MKRYKAAAGAQFDDKGAQRYGEALEELERRLGRAPDADDIWQAARNENSPLHDAFQWDVKKAAIQYWRVQARHIASHVEVFVSIKNEAVPMRAYYAVKSHPEEPRRYVSTDRISESPYMREQLIQLALKEADSWSKKYNDFKEFKPIHRAIRSVMDSKGRKRRGMARRES